MSITIDELKLLMSDLGGLFGFSGEVDAGTLMSLLDSDGNKEISWQVRWQYGGMMAVWRSDSMAYGETAACSSRDK